ncbi:G-type lectin S-receptor-like serine/threonine-protein kinase [Senna tora]|uniref:Receptor-like serine/threonine-protein kinase n=1 Tax=Senna tora TaxID=362788 RepID=A0A834TK68_9FABA|nr:G-type lectin S-receptor-like serine/threonine-protein kinase [Senna tora]
MASQNPQDNFQDYLPFMVGKLGGDGLIDELCNGFNLLMDSEKGVITFDSLKRNSAFLGLQGFSDEDLRSMLRQGDFDGDGALNQLEFCVLMFRLSPELMEGSKLCSSAADYVAQFQSIPEGKTLVSEDGSFELGFFSPGSSSADRYLGIWYKNIPVRTVVWVANRISPIKDKSGMLSIDREGNLVLLSHNETVVWSANPRRKALSPIVQLLDSGNLVLRDENDKNPENFLWQSFDYPGDTLLPGMKLGWDLKTGLNWTVSAWKNWDDPSPGDFSWSLVINGYPQLVMWKGSSEYYRSGPWNGLQFDGAPELKNNPLFKFKFVSTEDQLYYTYNLTNKSVITRIVMNQTIFTRQRYVWIEEAQSWRLYASVPRDNCDNFNLCGPYGNCVMGESPVCQCLTGFEPKSPQNWDLMDWTQGCVRSEQLSCHDKNEVGFVRFSGLKYPASSHSWVNESMNLQECRDKCLGNCTCTAYANSDIRGGGSGCMLWFGDLMDIREISGDNRDLYIRMKTSNIAVKDEHKKKVTAIIVIVVSVVVIILIFSYIGKSMKQLREETKKNLMAQNNDEGEQEDLELPLLDLATIVKATEDFSINKKLGQGGFGAVYRGTLVDGREIAVKRLSQCSGQGVNEFKNEVILISKLQHRNLVKLLGCCIQGEEKMLVYEYLPNRSLDFFIFEALRCIHISLLCVQQHPEDRPSMSTVAVMLSSESALPEPMEPAYIIEKTIVEADSSTKHLLSSTNEISLTMLEPR